MSKPNNVTGRDGSIIAKALAYAITTIDNLPDVRQEGSDRDDMVMLLAAMIPDETARVRIMHSARSHMGFEQFFLKAADQLTHSN